MHSTLVLVALATGVLADTTTTSFASIPTLSPSASCNLESQLCVADQPATKCASDFSSCLSSVSATATGAPSLLGDQPSTTYTSFITTSFAGTASIPTLAATASCKLESTLCAADQPATKCASDYSSCLMSATATVGSTATTIVVTAFTTVCPTPTTFTWSSSTWTVSSSTAITITDCPCTISVPYTGTVITPLSLPPTAASSSYAGTVITPLRLSTTAASTWYVGTTGTLLSLTSMPSAPSNSATGSSTSPPAVYTDAGVAKSVNNALIMGMIGVLAL